MTRPTARTVKQWMPIAEVALKAHFGDGVSPTDPYHRRAIRHVAEALAAEYGTIEKEWRLMGGFTRRAWIIRAPRKKP